MWKLKIGEGSSPWLRSVNGHVGHQVWEFDPILGSPEELTEIEKFREQFHNIALKRSIPLIFSSDIRFSEVYSNLEGNRSHTVSTGWALMSLIHAGQAERDPSPLLLEDRVWNKRRRHTRS